MSRPSHPAARRRLPPRAASAASLGAALLALSPVLAHAQGDAGSSLQLSGFGTVGALYGDDGSWGFKREASQAAHHDDKLRFDVDSRLGLQATWSLPPQWEFTGQLMLKPRSEGTSLQENVSQAFVAYHPTAEWTLRAGRTSPDLFLLADSRNVGFSYPWMRPSVDFYGWVPLMSVDGVDATRQWSLGDTQLTAKVFAGRSSLTVASATNSGDAHAQSNPIYSATLRADDGRLSVKGTVAMADSRSSSDGAIHQVAQLLDTLATLPVPAVASQAQQLRAALPAGSRYLSRYAALAATWDAQPWQLQAELSRIGGNSSPTKASYGYASATWRHDDVSLFGMGGYAHSSWAPLPTVDWAASLAPILGAVGAATAQYAANAMATNYNQLRVHQRSVSAGLRWDFMPQADFKVQVDHVRTDADGSGLWTYGSLSPHHATILSTGLDFVF